MHFEFPSRLKKGVSTVICKNNFSFERFPPRMRAGWKFLTVHPDIHYAAQSGAQTASNSCKGSEHNETKYKINLKEIQQNYDGNTAELQKKYNKRKVRPWSTMQLRVELKLHPTLIKDQNTMRQNINTKVFHLCQKISLSIVRECCGKTDPTIDCLSPKRLQHGNNK